VLAVLVVELAAAAAAADFDKEAGNSFCVVLGN
jgi:hypothetical protein